MDLKKKLKLFLNEIKDSTGNRQLSIETSPDQLASNPAVSKYKPDYEGAPLRDPQADRDAIESIESDYFSSTGFDPGLHELLKVVERMDRQAISDDERKLRRQLEAVSRKVSELVLAHHPDFASELQKVMELGVQLKQANGICMHSRSQLATSRKIFTSASLGLLANTRKRQQMIMLLKSLRTIKTLLKTDVRLREMVDEENYSGAIQLCLECQKAAETFRQYHCISELSTKLQDTLEMIEEALDVALSRSCTYFDASYYGKVQLAYRHLGKTQTSIDQLLMHYSTAIHNTAFTKVLGYVELCAGSGGSGQFQKRQYSELCQNISSDVFMPCLTDLCKALWEIMKCYKQTMLWHQKNDVEQSTESSKTLESEPTSYVHQKLENGLSRIWGDIQQKVKIYLISSDMSHFKYDEFIAVLDIVNRLIKVGEDFCGSKSESLQDSLRKQSLNYFKSYHSSKIDELRVFLENECWQLCPVKQTFTVFLLQEFRFLRHSLVSNSTTNKQDISAQLTQPTQKQTSSFFDQSGTPFDLRLVDEDSEDLLDVSGIGANMSSARLVVNAETDSDDEIPDELKQDTVDEKTGEPPNSRVPSSEKKKKKKKSGRIVPNKPAPIVTNTTLEVCRRIGSYMHMMNVLKPIAFDVVICLTQLFDYYLYSIYSFYAASNDTNSEDINEQYLSNRLRVTLRRIRDNLIEQPMNGSEMSINVGQVDQHDRVRAPHLSPIVNLNRPEGLFGLNERIVAMESLVFLTEQFEFLQPHLEAMIPDNKKAFLSQFYSQTVNTAQELRRPVYRASASRVINTELLVTSMQNVRWDIHELMSQHSQYVDVLLQELGTFHSQLATVSKTMPIPKVVSDILWEHCIRIMNRSLVEGFGSAKKCTNEGRALMQLDYQQLIMKIEKMSELRPVPDREYVESFIKAFYLPEDQVESWIRDHKEYSVRQVQSLVTCMAHLQKRTRSKVTTMLEEMADKIRR